MSHNRSLAPRLQRHFSRALAASAVAAGTAQLAEATIVYSGPVNINIPSTTQGVYLDVITGGSSAAPGDVPGWDVNPWNASNLSYFNPTAPTGGVYVIGGGTGTSVANLAFGTPIGAASVYGSGNASTTGTLPHLLNSSDNLIGFRFQDELDGQTHYAWMRISLAATLQGQPRTIVEYAYEDQAGVDIAAGAVTSDPNANGACCFPDGTCQATTYANCQPGVGSFRVNATCAAAACPPGGSCCLSDGTCQVRTSALCTAAAGIWGGAGSACTSCTGGCCNPDGTCTVVSAQACASNAASTYLGNGTTCAGGNCQPISFVPVWLTYNWNGIVSSGNEQGAANYSNAVGYRAIADRGLILGAAGSIASGVTGTDSMPYTIATADGVLDIVHLGDRTTVANSARNWGTSASNAAQPSWLINNDQATIDQDSPLPSGPVLTVESRIGFLYQVSDSGGRFDCVLKFSDNSSATITLRAADWFSNNFPVTPAPTSGSGLIVQRTLGSFTATQNTDLADSTTNNLDVVEAVTSVRQLQIDGFGNFAGKRLSGLTFRNPVSNANYATGTPATFSGYAILAASVSYPGTACYANCDGSTQAPVLNVQDFTCFLQKFAAANPYANCDNSTTAPVLNVQDFTCFLQKFAAGCAG